MTQIKTKNIAHIQQNQAYMVMQKKEELVNTGMKMYATIETK